GAPGNPSWRDVLDRVGRTSAQGGMPPLAKDVVDADGLATLEAFVGAR
ncbi:MAG: hypothetical protein JNM69_22820, partial [Archangium sp.]|nr:hypothetical protein [Archangium sp.]